MTISLTLLPLSAEEPVTPGESVEAEELFMVDVAESEVGGL